MDPEGDGPDGILGIGVGAEVEAAAEDAGDPVGDGDADAEAEGEVVDVLADPDLGLRDVYGDVAVVVPGNAQGDGGSGRVLDGGGDEEVEGTNEACPIGVDGGERVGELDPWLDAAFTGGETEGVGDGGEEHAEVEGGDVRADGAGADAAQLDDAVDEVQEVASGPSDAIDGLGHGLCDIAVGAVGQEFLVAEDGGERGTQFVCDEVEEGLPGLGDAVEVVVQPCDLAFESADPAPAACPERAE